MQNSPTENNDSLKKEVATLMCTPVLSAQQIEYTADCFGAADLDVT